MLRSIRRTPTHQRRAATVSEREERKKALEVTAAARVAKACGCDVEAHSGEFPDVYFVKGTTKTPGEVVSAWERQPDQPPEGGAANAQAWKLAQREADRIQKETGQPAIATANGPHWFAGKLDEELPLPLFPIYPAHSITTAVKQKIDKGYPKGVILVIDHCGFPLEVWELHEVADSIGAHDFAEIWIVPALGNDVQQLPAPGTPVPVDEDALHAYHVDAALDVIEIGLRDNCEEHYGFAALKEAREDGRLDDLDLDGTPKDAERVAHAAGLALTIQIENETRFVLSAPACRADHKHHNRYTRAAKEE